MNITSVRRFRLLGLAGVPLVALLVAVLVLAFGHSSAPATQADSLTAPEMHFEVTGAGINCAIPTNPGACNMNVGSSFTLRIRGNDGATPNVAIGFASLVYLGGLKAAAPATSQIQYTPCGLAVAALNASGAIGHGCSQFGGSGIWTNEPSIAEFTVTCNSKGPHKVDLAAVLPAPPSPTGGSKFLIAGGNLLLKAIQGPQVIDDPVLMSITVLVADTFVVTCKNPTATPTFTPVPPTATRTNTFTPTNTPAAPPIMKCVPGTGFGAVRPSPTANATATATATAVKVAIPCSSLQNLWLTRQGAKIPPVTCLSGTAKNTFQVGTDTAVTSLDPKNLPKIQDVGAFEFQVNYNAQKTCVTIAKGLDANGMVCTIQDSLTKPSLEGVARIGCVTVGKPLAVNGIWILTLQTNIPGVGAITITCRGSIRSPSNLSAYGLGTQKGNMSADFQVANTGGFAAGGFGCNNATVPSYGWIASPKLGAVNPALFPAFNGATGQLVGFIPFVPGGIQTASGSIVGKFTQNAFTGKAQAPTLLGVLVFQISGVRVGRLPLTDLAKVTVRPQPDLFSQGKPNQDNGNVVQLVNKKCELADIQGHPINTLTCDDAEVTIRWLEGDVEPDCSVDTLDTQAIAFRWGSQKGSLIYNDRFNLEPSGTQADNDIDIKDLQFVFGRFGSTCTSPWPVQGPVNAKA